MKRNDHKFFKERRRRGYEVEHMKARLGKEIHVEMPDRVGVLADVLSSVSGAGASMQAMLAYGQGGKGHFMMLTSDNVKAAKALQRKDYGVEEEDVVVVEFPDTKGAGALLAQQLAKANINVHYTYAGSRGKNVVLVANTSDNERAVQVLSSGKSPGKRSTKKSGKTKAKRSKKSESSRKRKR